MYSIVIPCYSSSHTIRQVVEETAAKMEEIGRTPFEFILVDDCSPDEGETVRVLHELADEHPYVTVVELAINAGQHNAMMAGLNKAEGDAIISMDDDMQTHPSQLPKLFEKFDEGYDVVYAYYKDKKHSGFRNFGSWVNFNTVRILIGKPKDMKTSSFWIIRKFVRDSIIQYKPKYTYLQGLFLRTTKNIACVPVDHFERAYGKSGYTLKKLIGLWSNIMGFSIVPLRFATRFGGLVSILALLAAVVVVIRKLLHPELAVGWASTMVTITFFSGVIIMFLGLIGEYVGRMFMASGHDPQYVIRTIYKKDKETRGSLFSCLFIHLIYDQPELSIRVRLDDVLPLERDVHRLLQLLVHLRYYPVFHSFSLLVRHLVLSYRLDNEIVIRLLDQPYLYYLVRVSEDRGYHEERGELTVSVRDEVV